MISTAMAVAAVGTNRFGRAEQAREARFARLVALILDTIFVGLLSSIATAVYGTTQFTAMTFAAGGVSFGTSQLELPAIWTAGIWIAYYTVCEAMFSATPGKALNGLRVVSDDGTALRVRSLVIRNLLRLIDVLPTMYLIGGFSVLVTPCCQRLGDLAAHTTVVFRQHAVEPGTARSSGGRARVAFLAALAALLAFTAAFDYFERPVLVIQGEFNQHALGNPGLVSFSLGSPTRTLDTITYPINARSTTESCTGTVALAWAGLFGWTISSSELECLPS